MYQQDYILQELKELSPTLANVGRINVFTVPDGYFDTLSNQVLPQLYAEDAANMKAIKVASVPEGYFENLAGNIMARIKKESMSDAAAETKSISELIAGIGNKNIFSVPQQYFDGLSNSLIAQTKIELFTSASSEINSISKLVAGIGYKNVYTVPQGYFDEISTNIIAQTKNSISSKVAEETFAISELVACISNKNVYAIPQGYFDGMAEQIKRRLFTPAKVVSIKNRFSAFRYAAAAVVTGLIGLSAFFLLSKNNDKNISSAPSAAVMTEAKHILTTNSFDKELSSVSDASIVSFLESKGQNVEAALVASLSDDKNLPDAADYLLNDNTLDEILKTLDLNN